VKKGLIGKKKGEDVFIETPGGLSKYKIVNIERV
jgi:transcription elongation GreA/GreB family factor